MCRGLALAVEYKDRYAEGEIFMDSQLVVNQFLGNWQIKNEQFNKFNKFAHEQLNKIPFAKWKGLKWVRRGFNQEADRLSKDGLFTSQK